MFLIPFNEVDWKLLQCPLRQVPYAPLTFSYEILEKTSCV